MFNKPASTENNPSVVPPTVTAQPTVSEPAIPTSPPPQQSSKKLLMIVSAVILILVAAFGTFAMMQQPTDIQPDPQPTTVPTTTPAPTEEAVFCTMDAKICPDGSSVGRVPPSCEFSACPGEEADGKGASYRSEELGFNFDAPANWPQLDMKLENNIAGFYLPLKEPAPDRADASAEPATEFLVFFIREMSPPESENDRILGITLGTKEDGQLLVCGMPNENPYNLGSEDSFIVGQFFDDLTPCRTSIPAGFSLL